MNLQFVNGWVLLLGWAVLALAGFSFLIYRRKQTALKAFMAEPMLTKLAPSIKPARFYWQMALAYTGLLLLLVAAARPQWGSEEKQVFHRGRDLVIALDVSRSMLARDVHPDRLRRAKADIQDLIRELHGDRVALITFRGRAIQLCPLTVDYAYFEQILDEVTTESAPRGETNIGDAIYKALSAFESDEGSHRALILISDGEDLAGGAKTAAEKAKEKGVVIFTVGLGDPKGTAIPGASKSESHLTYQGKEVITKLHHETLREIAEITGGAYVPVGVANVKLGKLYRDHLSKISARDIEESLQKRMIDRYQLFLFPGILFLLVSACLSRGRLATRKNPDDTSANHAKTFFPHLRAAKLILLFSALAFNSFQNNLEAVTNQPTVLPMNAVPALAHGRSAGMPAITDGAPQSAGAKAMADRTAAPQSIVMTNAATAISSPPETFATGREGACKAQQYYRLGAYDKSASAYLHAMSNSSPLLQNDCLFNAGCAFYRGNNFNKAAECFSQFGTTPPESAADGRRLDARENTDPSKPYYNLGCATFRLAEEAGKMGTNRPPELKPYLLEKAGSAFQRSLRAKSDHNAAANLAAITNLLPKAREEAKLQTLMAKYGSQPPPQLTDTMLQNQRNIIQSLGPALTNPAPSRISQFENLAEQQRANADILIPLKLTLLNALNAQDQGKQQIPQIDQHLEATRNSMDEGFNSLRDIDNRAYHPVTAAERGIYNLWKGLADFTKLLKEDIRRQTNTICMTTSLLAEAGGEIKAAQEEQKESHELTQLFTNRFAQAVPPGGTPAGGTASGGCLPGAHPTAPLPSDDSDSVQTTNEAPQITAEARTNILYLADQAIKTQAKAGEYLNANNIELSLPEQRRSYDLLKEIEKLLPKDKNKQQDQQKQDQQQNQDKQPQNENKEKKENKQQPPQPKEQEQPPPPGEEEQQKPRQPKEQPAEQDKKEEKEMTPEQLRALLEKAQQREKEHREEKMRDEYIPPSPVERDW